MKGFAKDRREEEADDYECRSERSCVEGFPVLDGIDRRYVPVKSQIRVLLPILSPSLPRKAPTRKLNREHSACRSEIRKLLSRGSSHNRATASASCVRYETFQGEIR